jgi:nitrite reductase/ring-hydroxylating ferredoxin subunit
MAWHLVCANSEIRDEIPFLVTVKGREIGIIRRAGSYYGLLNFCPHAGAPICAGRIEDMVAADGPREPARVEAGRPVIRCPWHHWEFDLTSGQPVAAIAGKLRVFPVKIEDDQVWVEV